MNYEDIDNENYCFPNRLNGKKQTCLNPELFEVQETITIEGMDLDQLKNNKGKLINIFLQRFNVEEKDFSINIRNNKFRIRALKQSIISFQFQTHNVSQTKNSMYNFNQTKIMEAMNTIPGFTIKSVTINSITEKRIDITKPKIWKRTLEPRFKPNQTVRFNTLKFNLIAYTLIDTNVYVNVNGKPYGDILNGSPALTIPFEFNENMMNTNIEIRLAQKKNGELLSYYTSPLIITLDSKVSLPKNFIVQSSNPPIIKKVLKIIL